MREIKFKGKSINTGEWCESMTISNGTIKRKRDDLFMETNEGKWLGIDPKTLGQFTGVKDKNNKDIFEGDIVRILYTDWCSKSSSDQRTLAQYLIDIAKIGYITFIGDRYYVVFKNKYKEDYYDSFFPGEHGYIEVIGNIYDNPEIL
jgi:uncharacterized phage protein (TIGR01671 family)